MSAFFPELHHKQQRGSKPRCHLLTEGGREEVAGRLTSLIEPWGNVRATDRWMPFGFDRCDEAQLHRAAAIVPNVQDRNTLRNWWLAVSGAQTTTPNIDIASTCLVQGRPGILLIEAKAHDYEMRKEEHGKKLRKNASSNSKKNHERIGLAIEAASESLSEQTELIWALSRDTHYQMSNRFAWAWKLTELGMPVILVYLGFLCCDEMSVGKKKQLIADHQDWADLLRRHSRPLFPDEIWNRAWKVHGQAFIPLIATTYQSLCRAHIERLGA